MTTPDPTEIIIHDGGCLAVAVTLIATTIALLALGAITEDRAAAIIVSALAFLAGAAWGTLVVMRAFDRHAKKMEGKQ